MVKQINAKKILIAGDAMLDVYRFGIVSRISPEAPVPVFLETNRKKCVPGGAANVAVNISVFNVEIDIFCGIGPDESGTCLKELLRNNGVGISLVVELPDRQTTRKCRYIAQNNQQIMRTDSEDISEISDAYLEKWLDTIESGIDEYGLVLISDYKKGFITESISQRLINICRGKDIPVLVDVKDRNLRKYKNATLIKPNRGELHELSGLPVSTVEEVAKASRTLCKMTACKYVLTTLGSEGMILVDENQIIKSIKGDAREVYDVTGAGDTSIAYLAVSILQGKSIEDAMHIANIAAGIQVGKVGTSIVKPEEVELAMQKNWLVKKTVFTNGCFDILHSGHIEFLNKARALGDRLIVGINSDESVRRLKGDERPINTLEDRMAVLKALSCVDEVLPFNEDTPLELIRKIHPDILVKGGDYELHNIVGADDVLAYGGEVKIIDYKQGKSTTTIISKIKSGNES
ncbi:D-glycero-beta-D-manno-heptose 1-phosphate adenylyltransferase [Lachnospiraceae bacterium C1.1]|nr:D-glycero-beta-D-manno-heptose 1-phosphate adenylyltransferase [Lachnospiraceae bacterium C1.1]